MHSFLAAINIAGDFPPVINKSSAGTIRAVESASLLMRADMNKNFISLYESVGGWLVCSGALAADKAGQELLFKRLLTGIDVNVAVSDIDGQFSAVCYMSSSNNCFLISDPSGLRSLYYTVSKGVFYVATVLSAIRDVLPNVTSEVDLGSQAFLLRYGYLPPGETVYKGVNELMPAGFKVINTVTGGCVDEGEFSPDLVEKTPEQSTEGLYDVLVNSLARQYKGGGKVGVLLGGFDSALVAALLCRMGANVETYSFSYSEKEFNQPFADELAEYLGVKHHWVSITPEIIRRGLEEYSLGCSAPSLWPSYVIQTQYLCRVMAESGVTACFSGDGCDTAFMGYPSTFRRGGAI